MKKILLFLFILPLFACGDLIDDNQTSLGGDYMYKVENKEVTIISLYDNHSENVVIPEKISNYPVTKIENNACKNFKNLKSISFPSTLTKIGTNILTGCTNLEEATLTFTDEASYVKYYFGGMENDSYVPESLIKINIAEGDTKIYPDAFYGLESVEFVNIPNTVTEIEARAFKNCQNLRSISFFGDLALTRIDSTAIDVERLNDVIKVDDTIKDSMIKPVIIVNSVVSQAYKNFFEDAFGKNVCLNIYKDEMIKDSFLMDGTTIIRYLGNASEIIIPTDATKIALYAFSHIRSVKSITLGEKIKEIENFAFLGDSNLEEIKLNNTLEWIGEGSFMDCINLKDFTIPSSVTKIGLEAFANCQSLRNITIPSNVLSLGSYVFRNANPELLIEVCFSVSSIPATWQSDWNRGISSSNIHYQE